MNPTRKRDCVVRDIRKFRGKFTSVVDMKVKLMEEFDTQVPPTTRFSVGYFAGRQSTKKWLVTQEDLTAMYAELRQAGKNDVCLWCDGCSEESESENQRKRKRDGSPGPPSKRAEKEREIDDLVAELKEMHSDKCNLSDPQYRLWARMITNGIHSSKETPPQVPMITGTTPTRTARKSMEETVASTVTAVMKGMGAAQPQKTQPNTLAVQSPLTSPNTQTPLGVSPSKAVEIRGKCFSQLASLKQLFEEAVITEEELKEQKCCIFETLRKLS